MQRAPLARRLPWLVLAAGLVGEATVLLVQSRKLWFSHDDFSFLLGRRLSPDPINALMAPHNVHWSTLPFIVFRVMWHLFGMRHYLPYALMPIVLHLTLVVALTVLIRRSGAGVWPAVLSGLVFAFLGGGAGAGNPLWAFQIGFIGSCMAGVLAVLCLDVGLDRNGERPGRRWFWASQVFLIASLMSSGMALPMVGVAAVWMLLRRGWAAAVRVVALPVVLFLAWFGGWGHTGPFTQPLGPALLHAPVNAARAIGSVWSAATDVTDTGPLVLVVLVVAVRLSRHAPMLRILGIAGLAGLAFEYLILAVGRADLDDTLRSRYVYVGLAVCAPAVACLFELIAHHRVALGDRCRRLVDRRGARCRCGSERDRGLGGRSACRRPGPQTGTAGGGCADAHGDSTVERPHRSARPLRESADVGVRAAGEPRAR